MFICNHSLVKTIVSDKIEWFDNFFKMFSSQKKIFESKRIKMNQSKSLLHGCSMNTWLWWEFDWNINFKIIIITYSHCLWQRQRRFPVHRLHQWGQHHKRWHSCFQWCQPKTEVDSLKKKRKMVKHVFLEQVFGLSFSNIIIPLRKNIISFWIILRISIFWFTKIWKIEES